MKRFCACSILSFLMLICLCTQLNAASTYRGEKSVGVLGGYTTCNKTAIAGIYFQYRINKYLRLSPNLSYSFTHYNTDAYSFNFNVDIPFFTNPESRINFYPLAGLNFTSWNTTIRPNIDDTTTRTNRFGFNIGAGIEYRIKPTLKLAMEGKYQYVRHFDAGVFSISIGYIF